jgi:hypothetical protein
MEPSAVLLGDPHQERPSQGARQEPGVPPCNVGQRSTPDYEDLANEAHLLPLPSAQGVNALTNASVHSIAIQVPIRQLTRDGSTPTDVAAAESVIGAWTSAHRQRGTMRDEEAGDQRAGRLVQVSRLGNPLFNEVIVPMSRKDRWNRSRPAGDADYQQYVYRPELAGLLPVLYPGAFPNLAAYDEDRADLHAILLTGILPQRAPGVRRCRDGGAACGCRADDSPRRPELHARWRRERRGRRHRTAELPHHVPLLRDTGERLRRHAAWCWCLMCEHGPGLDHGHAHDHHHGHAHDHRHDHSHDHGHVHDPERYYGGAVMLDIGGDHGALLVELDATWLDRELFIRPAGDPDGEFHVAVWRRPVEDGTTISAVFGSLVQGDYEILEGPGGGVLMGVTVTGAELMTVSVEPAHR